MWGCVCGSVGGGWGGKGGKRGQGFSDSPGFLGPAEGITKQSGAPALMGRDNENLGLGRNSIIVETKRWKVEDQR